MAKFYDGNWFGTHYKVMPIEKSVLYEFPPFRLKIGSTPRFRITFPYFTSNKVKFIVREVKRDKGFKPLTNFKIYETYSILGGETTTRPIDMSDKVSHDERQIEIRDETEFPFKGQVVYSIDKPGSPDYRTLASADLQTDDDVTMKLFYIFMGTIIGAITSPLALLISGLLKMGR